MTPSTHQLLLVKCLYERGKNALGEPLPFSAGVAVSHFQDAVELLLWATAVQVDAKPTEKFDSMWDSIKQGSKCPPGKEPPLRSAMTSLNKARVGFKHYGVTPDVAEAFKFGAYTEEFLTTVFREFFGVDFATFSMVQLIQNPKVLVHLKAAEQALAQGAAVETVEESAKAHAYLDLELNRILPRMSVDFDGFVARSVIDHKISHSGKRTLELENVVNAQRNFLAASTLGIQLADFLRFTHLGPQVFFIPNGVHVDWALEEKRTTVTQDDAEFALRYVTKFALAVERTLAGVKAGANLATW